MRIKDFLFLGLLATGMAIGSGVQISRQPMLLEKSKEAFKDMEIVIERKLTSHRIPPERRDIKNYKLYIIELVKKKLSSKEGEKIINKMKKSGVFPLSIISGEELGDFNDMYSVKDKEKTFIRTRIFAEALWESISKLNIVEQERIRIEAEDLGIYLESWDSRTAPYITDPTLFNLVWGLYLKDAVGL